MTDHATLIGELTEARQQLETAQAEIVDLKQAIWDGCHHLGFDTDGDPTPAALVHPPLGQLLAQVIADHMAIDVEADCECAYLEARLEAAQQRADQVDECGPDAALSQVEPADTANGVGATSKPTSERTPSWDIEAIARSNYRYGQDANATIERVRALCDSFDPTSGSGRARAFVGDIRAALGAAVNDSSTEEN